MYKYLIVYHEALSHFQNGLILRSFNATFLRGQSFMIGGGGIGGKNSEALLQEEKREKRKSLMAVPLHDEKVMGR